MLIGAAAGAGCSGAPTGEPVFCYQWLLDVSCYTDPYPGADARLLGVYLRDPGDPATKSYWLDRAQARMSR
jgi:hypothetical protein